MCSDFYLNIYIFLCYLQVGVMVGSSITIHTIELDRSSAHPLVHSSPTQDIDKPEIPASACAELFADLTPVQSQYGVC